MVKLSLVVNEQNFSPLGTVITFIQNKTYFEYFFLNTRVTYNTSTKRGTFSASILYLHYFTFSFALKSNYHLKQIERVYIRTDQYNVNYKSYTVVLTSAEGFLQSNIL